MAVDWADCFCNCALSLLAMDVGKMNILECPDCGGTHFGSRKCPIKYPPEDSSMSVDIQLARIDHERVKLKAEYRRRMERLDRRERSLLGLKE